MSPYDTSKTYIQYIEDVISGKEIAGELIILACKRAKSWFDRDDIELHYDVIDKKINLVQKIKHKKGLLAGQQFILLPFQQFIFMNIFGWYYTGTPKRVISNVLLMMARQTGKTYTAASISLAIALDPELPAPTVDFIANSAKQASICFGHCKDQCASLDPQGKIFSRYRSEIRIPITGASINVLSSDSTRLDGRASYAVCDEIHEMKDWSQWEIMKSGQGSLKNPLMIGISTAGYHMGEQYPLYSMWEQGKKILHGDATDDTWFFMIFQMDEDDKWDDPTVWKKAIPTLGIAVDNDFIKNRIQEAKNIPSKEVDVKVKNLNMFVQSKSVWFNYEFLKSISKPLNIYDFEGEYIYIGADFSQNNDLSAFVVLIPPNPNRSIYPDKLIYFPYIYIPRDALENSPNRILYERWNRNKQAKITDGNVIDTIAILNDIVALSKHFNIMDIAIDPYFALEFTLHAQDYGLPITKHQQSLAAFTPTVDYFEIQMAKENVILADNPTFIWMFNNVEMMRNERFNLKKPGKANDNPANKIDAVIASLEATTAYLTNQYGSNPTVWTINTST